MNKFHQNFYDEKTKTKIHTEQKYMMIIIIKINNNKKHDDDLESCERRKV